MSREAGTGTRAVPLGEEATALRLLFVEDREDDCLLMVRELRDVMGGLAWRRVDSEPDLRQALAGESWDAVIADVHVPGLSLGLSLSLVAEVDRELPVIVVSGHVGEETAADVMKSGARDFVSKDRLARLRPAVEREVAEATVRRDARRQVGLRERRLEVLNRLYSVLARVGEAVVRRRDRDLLMGEVARILREDGGFRLVWVGSVDRAAGRVHPMAGIGTDDGFPTTAAFPLDREQEAGSGPPGAAVRTGQVSVCTDVERDDRAEPWRDDLIGRGVRSWAALPLRIEGEVVAVVNLCHEATEAFDEEHRLLLERLADMLSYGLESIEGEARRLRAEEALAANQERLRSLAYQLTLTAERERRRLAVELHDEVGQLLALGRISLGRLRDKARGSGFEVQIDEVRTTLEEAIRATRAVTSELSPPSLHDLGLVAGLEAVAEGFQQRHGIPARIVADGAQSSIDDETRLLLFAAVRELLVNAARHAQATRVTVRVRSGDGAVRVEVCDDGSGFVPTQNPKPGGRGGFGLYSIRERLATLEGRMEIDSARGRGTVVTLTVPLREGGGTAG